MSEDTYVFEAIDIEPPVTEAEVEPMISAGKYQKVTWADKGRIGDGYFVKVGDSGVIGLAMAPMCDEDGVLRHRGICVQGNPLDEAHQDLAFEDQLREIVADFGIAPDGTSRTFDQALYVQEGDAEYKLIVEDGRVVKVRVVPSESNGEQQRLLTLSVTKYEADLLRQIVALDIHDWKSGDMPTDPMDPAFASRRAAASETLLAKLNEILG